MTCADLPRHRRPAVATRTCSTGRVDASAGRRSRRRARARSSGSSCRLGVSEETARLLGRGAGDAGRLAARRPQRHRCSPCSRPRPRGQLGHGRLPVARPARPAGRRRRVLRRRRRPGPRARGHDAVLRAARCCCCAPPASLVTRRPGHRRRRARRCPARPGSRVAWLTPAAAGGRPSRSRWASRSATTVCDRGRSALLGARRRLAVRPDVRGPDGSSSRPCSSSACPRGRDRRLVLVDYRALDHAWRSIMSTSHPHRRQQDVRRGPPPLDRRRPGALRRASPACSARTAPARPPCCGSWRPRSAPTRARSGAGRGPDHRARTARGPPPARLRAAGDRLPARLHRLRLRRLHGHPQGVVGPARPARARYAACSTSSASATSHRSGCARCPAASAAGSCSPRRCSATPTCWSSTSRPPASTRSSAPGCATSSVEAGQARHRGDLHPPDRGRRRAVRAGVVLDDGPGPLRRPVRDLVGQAAGRVWMADEPRPRGPARLAHRHRSLAQRRRPARRTPS